jgi:hypothetical protein
LDPPYDVPHWREDASLWQLRLCLGAVRIRFAGPGSEYSRNQPDTQAAQLEEIYVARSVRESRVAPTEFCDASKIGFKADSFEDRYTLRSIATASDGRMVNANLKAIGAGHGCFGRSDDPGILNFYLDLHMGRIALRGMGDCRQTKSDFPEQGLTVWRCFLNLSDPLGRYIGGQLTSNTITSRRDLGMEADPPGYTQLSIATIRFVEKTGRSPDAPIDDYI